ncbi:MAG: glycosyltransferase family 2 protein [Victivallales bacterium]|nr:glycosyltransferase family 2 protein [Victivallales bacterium]
MVSFGKKIKYKVSLLIPCYNEQEVLPMLRRELSAFAVTLSEKGYDHEIILVDDGSSDMTWVQIGEWAADDSDHVIGIELSRNFGHQMALTCAYEIAAGDVCVSIDADLQDPLEVIFEMLEKHEAGADIVLGVRRSREAETFFKLTTAKLYYKALHMLGLKFIEKDCGDFRLMNRRGVKALLSMRERNRMLRAMVCWTGFKVDKVYFDRRARAAGETKYPLRKMMLLAMDGVISFSTLPLRFAYWFASVIGLIIMGYLAYTLMKYLFFNGRLVDGWTSIILAVCAFGFVNLFCIGLIGEYVGRIYDEVKKRPLYFVRTNTRDKNEY